MSDFLLEKWYMDIVTPDGCAAIGYFAKMQWKKIALNYSGYILRNKKGDVTIKNSFRKANIPQWSDNRLIWKPPAFEGEWSAMDSPVHLKLLNASNGFVDWNCLIPKGRAKVLTGDESLVGWGYAEKISLTILPWQLPIKELYWGRFLSDDYALVWIEWRGPMPKTLLMVNGTTYEQVTISNDSIKTPDLLLAFNSKYPLRSGRIGDTVFKGIRRILSLFPTTIFQLNENKWCGVANLTIHNKQYNGTYIHEHVIWH
jgi:hypothetical protein